MSLDAAQLLIDGELQTLTRRVAQLEAQAPRMRDLYAGAALKALISLNQDLPPLVLARKAYALADAMVRVQQEGMS